MMAMHVTQPAPPVASRRPTVPSRLAEAVDRCLRKDPAERFADADAFVAAIGAAQGTAAIVVAPQLRNYIRIAESSFTQVISLALIFPSLAAMRPQAADVLLLLLVVTPIVTILQLQGRVRDLARDGFSLGDLDAAYETEARQREEEIALLVAARTRDGSIARGKRRALWVLLAGVAAIAAAIAMKRLMPGVLPPKLRGVIAGTGGAMLGVSFALRAMANPRTERRLTQVIGPATMRRLSAWLFRWSMRGDAARGQATSASAAAEIARLHGTLPRAVRRALGDLPTVAVRLEQSADALGARIAQLERAAADAERDASGPTLGAGGELGAAARAALDGRRAALAAELAQAAQAAAAARAERLAAVEGLRMGLLRLTSGLGRPDDLAPEVASARALLGESSVRDHR
jgi:serine/threonine-protein kinase